MVWMTLAAHVDMQFLFLICDGKMSGDDWTLAGCIRFVCFSLTSFPVTAFGDSCDFGEAKPIALGWDT